jgi:uncharacterized protein (DUF488 family)
MGTKTKDAGKSPAGAKKLYTIGYEDATLENFVSALKAAGIAALIDVRAIPLSRKPGFSKNRLAARLAEEDIKYLSLRGLGTPAEGRAAARKGRIAEMRAIFKTHLKSMEAVADLAEAVRTARVAPSCLLCYERNALLCHRALVADKIAARTRQKIVHLDALKFQEKT